MRRTRQRDAILETLRRAGRPLSPAEIVARAADHVDGINLSTIYRNLKLMGQAGEVAPVDCVGQSARYELAHLDHHHHFLCDECDRLFDLPGCREEALAGMAPDGFEVLQHHIQLSGRCLDCRGG